MSPDSMFAHINEKLGDVEEDELMRWEHIRQRSGFFSLADRDYRNYPIAVAELFSKLHLVIIRCEYMYASNQLEYTAVSPWFEINGELVLPSNYNITADVATDRYGDYRLADFGIEKGSGYSYSPPLIIFNVERRPD